MVEIRLKTKGGHEDGGHEDGGHECGRNEDGGHEDGGHEDVGHKDSEHEDSVQFRVWLHLKKSISGSGSMVFLCVYIVRSQKMHSEQY